MSSVVKAITKPVKSLFGGDEPQKVTIKMPAVPGANAPPNGDVPQPQNITQAAEAAGEEERKKNLKRKGFLSTILAGELTQAPQTSKRTLLG